MLRERVRLNGIEPFTRSEMNLERCPVLAVLARNLLLWLLRCFLVARIFQLPLLLLGRGLSLLPRLGCELRRELRRRGDSFLLDRRRLLAGALLRRLAQLLLLV